MREKLINLMQTAYGADIERCEIAKKLLELGIFKSHATAKNATYNNVVMSDNTLCALSFKLCERNLIDIKKASDILKK